MKRKRTVKTKAAVQKFKNGTPEWADHQMQLQTEADKKRRKEWDSGIEKSKQYLSEAEAEKYLNGGMDVLEHFAGRVMVASPAGPCWSILELEGLGRLISRHTARCLDLLCKTATHGEKSAARTVFNASVSLARVIQWIARNRPEYLPEMKDKSLLPLLDAWAKAAEMARDQS